MYIRLLVDGIPSGDVIASKAVPDGYARWFPADKPSDPNPIQEYVEGSPDGDSENGFFQTWTIQNKTFATTEEETEANNLHISLQWQKIRGDRDHRLSATDWEIAKHAEKGTTIPESLKTYRQALRDITKQSDPFDITWPDKPEGYA